MACISLNHFLTERLSLQRIAGYLCVLQWVISSVNIPLAYNLFHVNLHVENKQADIWGPCPHMELRIKSGSVVYGRAGVRMFGQSAQFRINHS
jgi:hypothetical protein